MALGRRYQMHIAEQEFARRRGFFGPVVSISLRKVGTGHYTSRPHGSGNSAARLACALGQNAGGWRRAVRALYRRKPNSDAGPQPARQRSPPHGHKRATVRCFVAQRTGPGCFYDRCDNIGAVVSRRDCLGDVAGLGVCDEDPVERRIAQRNKTFYAGTASMLPRSDA